MAIIPDYVITIFASPLEDDSKVYDVILEDVVDNNTIQFQAIDLRSAEDLADGLQRLLSKNTNARLLYSRL